MKTVEELWNYLINEIVLDCEYKPDRPEHYLEIYDKRMETLRSWGKELCEGQREICHDCVSEEYKLTKRYVLNAPLPTILKNER